MLLLLVYPKYSLHASEGELQVKKGKLMVVTAKSGHYKPKNLQVMVFSKVQRCFYHRKHGPLDM